MIGAANFLPTTVTVQVVIASATSTEAFSVTPVNTVSEVTPTTRTLFVLLPAVPPAADNRITSPIFRPLVRNSGAAMDAVKVHSAAEPEMVMVEAVKAAVAANAPRRMEPNNVEYVSPDSSPFNEKVALRPPCVLPVDCWWLVISLFSYVATASLPLAVSRRRAWPPEPERGTPRPVCL